MAGHRLRQKKHGFTYNRNTGSITFANNTGWRNGEENLKFDSGSHVFTNNLSFQSTNSDHRAGGTDVGNTNVWWINGVSTNGKGLVVSAADFVSLTPNIFRNADGSITGQSCGYSRSDLINAARPQARTSRRAAKARFEGVGPPSALPCR